MPGTGGIDPPKITYLARLSKEREPMSIRGRLMLLAMAVLVPSVVASLLAMTYLYRERERLVQGSLLEMS